MKFDSVEELLDHYDVEIDRKKSNKYNWVIRCPFHDDSHPSCSVHKLSGLYNCFACGAKGNAIHLIMELEGCEYETAEKIWEGDEEGYISFLPEKKGEEEVVGSVWDILKLMNNILFQTEPKKELDSLETFSYITEEIDIKRYVFLNLEIELLEEWFYFGYADFDLGKFEGTKVIEELQLALSILNGSYKETNKLNFGDEQLC